MKKVLSIIAVLFISAALSFGAVNSNIATVTLTQQVDASLTVSATPSNITLTGTTPSAPISVNTSWNLGVVSTLDVVAYFSSTDALTSGTFTIPSSSVFASINGGAASPITGPAVSGIGTAGASVVVAHQTAVPAGPGNRGPDTIVLTVPNIAVVTAGSYNGVLNIAATAF